MNAADLKKLREMKQTVEKAEQKEMQERLGKFQEELLELCKKYRVDIVPALQLRPAPMEGLEKANE